MEGGWRDSRRRRRRSCSSIGSRVSGAGPEPVTGSLRLRPRHSQSPRLGLLLGRRLRLRLRLGLGVRLRLRQLGWGHDVEISLPQKSLSQGPALGGIVCPPEPVPQRQLGGKEWIGQNMSQGWAGRGGVLGLGEDWGHYDGSSALRLLLLPLS